MGNAEYMGRSIAMRGDRLALGLVFSLALAAMSAPIGGDGEMGGEMLLLQEQSTGGGGGGGTTTGGTDPMSLTLPALTKEISDRESLATNLGSKLTAETKNREADTVKAAAAVSNLQTGLSNEVEQRGKAMEDATAANQAVKTSVQDAETQIKSNKAVVTAAVSKLDT